MSVTNEKYTGGAVPDSSNSTVEPVPLEVAAVQYAEAGRVVFPLGGGDGKRPLVKWSALEPGDRHVLQVRSWWRKWREANIALRTGGGLVVVDVDPRHGGAVDPGWPATLTAQTRGGGWHLYYQSDEPIGCSVAVVAPAVDIRGERGYVVAPPSPGWKWVNEAAIAPLPDLRLVAPARAGDGRPLAADWQPFELREEVSEGGRNDYLVRLGGWLLSQDVPAMDLEDWLQDYNTAACRPPLDQDEVAAIAASVSRYDR